MTLTPLQKLPKNGGDWGKLIAAKDFKKLPEVQQMAKSGHTGSSHSTNFATIIVTVLSRYQFSNGTLWLICHHHISDPCIVRTGS